MALVLVDQDGFVVDGVVVRPTSFASVVMDKICSRFLPLVR